MEPITNARLEEILTVPTIDVATGRSSATPILQAEARQLAAEVLNLRRRDAELGFSYDHATHTVEILGTKFARQVLEQFRTSSGADEYYQHVRRADGVVLVSRFLGLRETLRLLTHCVATAPLPDSLADAQFQAAYLEWRESAELLLQVSPEEVQAESVAIEELLAAIVVFRGTCYAPGEEVTPEGQRKQLEAAALLFSRFEVLANARGRLILWGLDKPQGYGTCMACGCTDEKACEGGCGWADETHTLCSRCAERVEHAAQGVEG